MKRTPLTRELVRRLAFVLASTVVASPLCSQEVAPPAAGAPAKAEKAITLPKPAAAKETADSEPVQLSPFEVNSARDRGYQATTTMSGTRLNSNLEDLAASISVVTRQQLSDTGSTDINSMFRYELNTEGTYQWTNFTVDRGVVTDSVAFDPQGSTRMRGLTSANIATNGYVTTLPVDAYNVDSVEISRGPNSSVFGLGNSGGGVNFIGASANDARSFSGFSTQGDSYGGYRETFDINRPIVPNKLAVRILGLYDDKTWDQKPSSDNTRRLQVAFAARPFKNTTIRASFESYRNFNSRPNSVSPRDMTTDWIASGMPTWDPTTLTVHFRGTAPSVNFGLAAVDTGFTGNPGLYVDDGQVQLFEINRTPNATGTGPTNISGANYLLQDGSYYTYAANQTANPLFQPKGITNKFLYDWTAVNLAAPNFETVKGETSNIEIQQSLLNTARQTLAFEAGWLYERTATNDRRFLGNGTTNLEPFIDINEKLLDGTVNPFFLRTYVGGSQPIFKKSRNNSENYRGTIAYQLDLSNEGNWLHWLGRNRFTGYSEYTAIHSGGLGYKDTMSSTEAWMNGPPASRNSSGYRTYPMYYVGDASGQNVDYAPKGFGSTPYGLNLRYYNGVTKQWINEPVDFNEYYYANRLNRRYLSTYGAVWQGFFLNDRIIPSYGVRRDVNRTQDGNSAINPTAATNGYYDTSSMTSFTAYDWVQNRGNTTNAGMVVKPLHWLDLTYSQSSSFNPGSLAYDVYGHPLPDPRGRTKDYGIELKLFKDRLVISAKQYETVDIGRGTSDVNTIVQRVVRIDEKTSSGDPGLTDFLNTQLLVLHPAWTQDQLDAEVMRLSGVDPNFIRGHINKTHGDHSDSFSRGKEIEIIYNPTNYWTMKATIAESKPFNGAMSGAVQDYITMRMPTWTTVTDPVSGKLWWTNAQANGTIPQSWYQANVDANLKLSTALQGKRRTQTREHRINYLTTYQLAGITSNRWLKNLYVGGAVHWEEKASIGYLGGPPNSSGIVNTYDPNHPVWDEARYYFDFWAGYNLHLFKDKVKCRLQFNVINAFESGRLQAVAVNPDGSPYAFRIIDPRQFVMKASFDL